MKTSKHVHTMKTLTQKLSQAQSTAWSVGGFANV